MLVSIVSIQADQSRHVDLEMCKDGKLYSFNRINSGRSIPTVDMLKYLKECLKLVSIVSIQADQSRREDNATFAAIIAAVSIVSIQADQSRLCLD